MSRITTVLLCTALLSACATPQGGGVTNALLVPLGLGTSDLADVFSSQMREFKKHMQAGNLSAAERFFHSEREYFSRRLASVSEPLSDEFKRLGVHIWTTNYATRVADATRTLTAIDSALDRQRWSQQSQALADALQLSSNLDSDFAVRVLRLGQIEHRALREQVQRVRSLAAASKSKALALTFEQTLNTGSVEPAYLGSSFQDWDYLESAEFQKLALQRLAAVGQRQDLDTEARRLAPLLSPASRSTVDQQYQELVRRELLADGRVSLEELSALSTLKTPFGNKPDLLAGLVRVGYVDLTSASFKNRNIFDFEIAFKKDLPLTFTAADESVFQSADWAGYDYLFVTDLAVAKVSREFKSRKPVKSRVQTGERQEPNPHYIGAMSAYQQAMAEFQRVQLNAAIPKACSGWGCLAQGIADGLIQSSAKSKVEEAAEVLSRTGQTLTHPVFSEYTYQSVDISTTKTADVNYYVIDTKGRRILRSNFAVNNHESFNVAYNVRDEDPDKRSILRNVKTEDEVTAWEKRAMEVPLSALFSTENLRSAATTPLVSVSEFVASLNTRSVVAASPSYARASPGGELRMAASSAPPPAAAQGDSQTIADERFDSIVLIQNPGSTGTGFYVTPELVLTAYHVVQNNSLVQMAFYDGTKTFGRVVDHDIRLDLALVRAQTAGKPLKIHTGPLKLGETVEAIGHPKGYEFTITRGVISAVRRQRSATIGSDALVEFVQTDTPISPGNSGGPLLLKDTVIGVNDWIRVDKGSQNLNFSVSYNEVRSFLDRFMAKKQ